MSLAHFTIPTRDVDGTTEFFQNLMGWREIPVPDNVEVQVRWLDLGRGAQMHVLGIEDFEVSPFEKEYGRHFAFFVSAERLADIKERLPRDYDIPVRPPLRATRCGVSDYRHAPKAHGERLIDDREVGGRIHGVHETTIGTAVLDDREINRGYPTIGAETHPHPTL